MSILVRQQTYPTAAEEAYERHLRTGHRASVCYRRTESEVVFYYFHNYSMRIEHLLGVDEFQWAVIRGNFDDMKQAIRAGADVNAPTADGLSPLQWAARRRHERCVQGLIARGAIVNASLLRSVEDNHMRDFIERCLLNRTVAQHHQMAMILLHNPNSPFRLFDVEGVLIELFDRIMPRRLPRYVLVDLLRLVCRLPCVAMRDVADGENVINGKRVQ